MVVWWIVGRAACQASTSAEIRRPPDTLGLEFRGLPSLPVFPAARFWWVLFNVALYLLDHQQTRIYLSLALIRFITGKGEK